jgi:hypothetical protein
MAELAENQTQDLIFQVAELQCKLIPSFMGHLCSSEGIEWEGMGS